MSPDAGRRWECDCGRYYWIMPSGQVFEARSADVSQAKFYRDSLVHAAFEGDSHFTELPRCLDAVLITVPEGL